MRFVPRYDKTVPRNRICTGLTLRPNLNIVRFHLLRLAFGSAFLWLATASAATGADAVYVFPEGAPISAEYLVTGDVVEITLTNLSGQPIGNFYISQHAYSGASLITASRDGQTVFSLLSENEFSTVYPGMYTHRWEFAGFVNEAIIRLNSSWHPASRTHFFASNPSSVFGVGIPDAGVSCCVGRVGDANGSGSDEPTIGDLSYISDCLFVREIPVACPGEADINRSGGDSPGPGDVTVGDISLLIDYLFIAGPDRIDLSPCP
jgi:hypothetical protein